MMPVVLETDDEAEAAVHDEVCPLIDKLNVVERRLWEEGRERQSPDNNDAKRRQRVSFDIFCYKFVHNQYFCLLFCCKIKKKYLLLQADYEEMLSWRNWKGQILAES